MKKMLLLLASHAVVLAIGFALGIYALPILTAPAAPSSQELAAATDRDAFNGQYRRDLKGSALLHWGEGTVAAKYR